MKIQIIGYSGAGKSTLAEQLAKHYKINHLYMDSVQFYGDFKSRSIEEQNALVRDFLSKNDNWVIDGNYYSVAPERYNLCDEIYFLDYPRLFCLKEALKRYFKNRNQFRESLGCVENFDFSFFMWIIYEGRTKYWKQQHELHFNKCLNRHRFKSRKELLKYLEDNKLISSK